MESKAKKQKVKNLSAANTTLPTGLSDYFSHQTINELEETFVDEDSKLDELIRGGTEKQNQDDEKEEDENDSDQQMEADPDDEEDLEEKEIELPQETAKTTRIGAVFESILNSEEPKVFSNIQTIDQQYKREFYQKANKQRNCKN
jgi:hypothetical protein